MVTITIPLAAAMNIEDMLTARINEIDQLQKDHPDLPMKDAKTYGDYIFARRAVIDAVHSALNATQPVK